VYKYLLIYRLLWLLFSKDVDKLWVVHKVDKTIYKDAISRYFDYADTKGITIKVTKVK